jgi:hypothetical protein
MTIKDIFRIRRIVNRITTLGGGFHGKISKISEGTKFKSDSKGGIRNGREEAVGTEDMCAA